LCDDGYKPYVVQQNDAAPAMPDSRAHNARAPEPGQRQEAIMGAIEGATRHGNGKRAACRSAIVVAASVIAIGVAGDTGAGAASNHSKAGGGAQVAWQYALSIRSQALNQKYRRHHALGTLGQPTTGWQYALWVRSDALNRAYRLGTYAPTP